MYHFKQIFPLFLLLSILLSCELYSDARRKPAYHPTLTIHAFMSQHDIQAVVAYTKPRDPTGEQTVPHLPELEVWLMTNGKETDRLRVCGKGAYRLDSMYFSPDVDYSVCVKDGAGQKILESGPDRLPAIPEIISVRYLQDTTTFPESNFLILELANSPKKYNGFDISRFYSIDAGETFYNSHDSISGIFGFRSLIKAGESGSGILRTTIKTTSIFKPDSDKPGVYIDAILVKVSHFSSGMMQFFEELKDAEETSNEPFAIQSPVYANISGGYGVFGSYYYIDTVLLLER